MSRFTILAVCTANICRSPAMEILFRQRLDPDRFEIGSAGVQGWRDSPVDSMVVLELERLGARADGFSSRPLDEEITQSADLILTATREHRSYVLARHPEALRRTFTLREFAELVRDDDGATSPDALVDRAYRRRSEASDDLDLADPYRRPPAIHRAIADQIDDAVNVIAAKLAESGR